MSIFDYVIAQSKGAPPQPNAPQEESPQQPISSQKSKSNIFDFVQSQISKGPEQPLQESKGTEIYPGVYSKEPSIPGIGEGMRHASRLGSRALEMTVGLPASYVELPQQAIIAGTELATGQEHPKLREKAEGFFKETGLPTAGGVRKKMAEMTGGYTEPQSPGEETADEVFQDIYGMMLPGPSTKAKTLGKVGQKVAKWLGPHAPQLLKSVGVAAAGQAAKEGIETLGGGEGAQNAGKIGTMIVASSINPREATRFKDSLYDKADAFLPSNAMTDATRIQSGMEHVRRKLLRGVPDKSKTPALEAIDAFQKKIHFGEVEVKELQQFKKDMYNKIGDWENSKLSHPELKRLAKSADIELRKYGEKSNPNWLKNWSAANEVHGALAQSDKFRTNIKRYVIPLMKSNPLWALPVFGIAGPAYPGLKSFELGSRVFRSPKLANLYTTTLINATKENAPAAAQSMKKLNDELSKELRSREEIDLSKY